MAIVIQELYLCFFLYHFYVFVARRSQPFDAENARPYILAGSHYIGKPQCKTGSTNNAYSNKCDIDENFELSNSSKSMQSQISIKGYDSTLMSSPSERSELYSPSNVNKPKRHITAFKPSTMIYSQRDINVAYKGFHEEENETIEMEQYGGSMSNASDISDQSTKMTSVYLPSQTIATTPMSTPLSLPHQNGCDGHQGERNSIPSMKYVELDDQAGAWLHIDNPHYYGLSSINSVEPRNYLYQYENNLSQDEELTSPPDSGPHRFADFTVHAHSASSQGTMELQGSHFEERLPIRKWLSPSDVSETVGPPWGSPNHGLRKKVRYSHQRVDQCNSLSLLPATNVLNKSIIFDRVKNSREQGKSHSNNQIMSRHVSMVDSMSVDRQDNDSSSLTYSPINKFETLYDLAHLDTPENFDDDDDVFLSGNDVIPRTNDYSNEYIPDGNQNNATYSKIFPMIPKIVLSAVDSSFEETECNGPSDEGSFDSDHSNIPRTRTKPRRIARANNPFGIEGDLPIQDTNRLTVPRVRRLSASSLPLLSNWNKIENENLNNCRDIFYQGLSSSSSFSNLNKDNNQRMEDLKLENARSWSAEFFDLINQMKSEDISKEKAGRCKRMIDERYNLLFGRKYSDVDKIHLWDPPQLFPGNLSPRFQKRRTNVPFSTRFVDNEENYLRLSDNQMRAPRLQERQIPPTFGSEKENKQASSLSIPTCQNVPDIVRQPSEAVNSFSQILRQEEKHQNSLRVINSSVPDIVKRIGPYGQERDDECNNSIKANSNSSVKLDGTTIANNIPLPSSHSPKPKFNYTKCDTDSNKKTDKRNIRSNEYIEFETKSGQNDKPPSHPPPPPPAPQETNDQKKARNVRSVTLPLIPSFRPRRRSDGTMIKSRTNSNPIEHHASDLDGAQSSHTQSTGYQRETNSNIAFQDETISYSGMSSREIQSQDLSHMKKHTVDNLSSASVDIPTNSILLSPQPNVPFYESILPPKEDTDHLTTDPHSDDEFQLDKEDNIYEKIDESDTKSPDSVRKESQSKQEINDAEIDHQALTSSLRLHKLRISPALPSKSNRLPLVMRKRMNRDQLHKNRALNKVSLNKPRSMSSPESKISSPPNAFDSSQTGQNNMGNDNPSLRVPLFRSLTSLSSEDVSKAGDLKVRNDPWSVLPLPENGFEMDGQRVELQNFVYEPPYATINHFQQTSISDNFEHTERAVAENDSNRNNNGVENRFPFDSPLVRRAEFKTSATYKPLQHTNSYDDFHQFKSGDAFSTFNGPISINGSHKTNNTQHAYSPKRRVELIFDSKAESSLQVSRV